MGRARDISKVFSTSTSLATDSEVSGSYLTQSSASTTYQNQSSSGLVKMVATSISSNGGTSSISSNGTITVSGVNNIYINGCFTSAYDNYKIIYSGNGNQGDATNTGLFARLRASGTDATTSYIFNIIYRYNSTTSSQNSGQSWFQVCNIGDYGSLVEITFAKPFLSEWTHMIATGQGTGSSSNVAVWSNGVHTSSSPYDGFSLQAGSGTVTGTISVYGYKK